MKKYFKHKLENLLVIDKIVTIHYFEFDKNFKSKVEAHDFGSLSMRTRRISSVPPTGRRWF